MPRPRTPMSIAKANGAAEINPGRFADRQNAPQPTGPLGDPPADYDEEQLRYWNYIVSLPAPGVLTSADRVLVEVAVYLYAALRGRYIKPVEIGHLRACLGSMGCTPADRSRVTAADEPEEEEESELDVILGSNGFGRAN